PFSDFAGNLGFALARFTSAGAPDGTFGSGGVATVIVDNPVANGFLFGGIGSPNIIVQGDGNIVLYTSRFDVTPAFSQTTSVVEVRFTSGGILDSSFGSGGVSNVALAPNNFVSSCAVQADGKVVMTGIAYNSDF